MRPPGGILAPGESVVATGNSAFFIFSLPHPPSPTTFVMNNMLRSFNFFLSSSSEFLTWMTVFKFVEPPENNEKLVDHKSKVKFKIMSLKVKGEMDYVPELVYHTSPLIVIYC
jgi:hypothetical protein